MCLFQGMGLSWGCGGVLPFGYFFCREIGSLQAAVFGHPGTGRDMGMRPCLSMGLGLEGLWQGKGHCGVRYRVAGDVAGADD